MLEAYGPAGRKDESWEKVVASQHVCKYAFPSISLDVVLSLQVPSPFEGKVWFMHERRKVGQDRWAIQVGHCTVGGIRLEEFRSLQLPSLLHLSCFKNK